MLLILAFRVAVLTIVHGEEFRKEIEIKKVKDIPIKAPRGKIFDVNGKTLAENKPSFTVKIRKDEISNREFLDIAFKLAGILEKNNEKVTGEFPIELNTIVYKNKSGLIDYEESINQLIGQINENKLIPFIIGNSHQKKYETDIKEKILLVLKKEIKDFPVEYKGGRYVYMEKSAEWLSKNGYAQSDEEELVSRIFSQNDRYLKSLMSNSQIRLYIFELFKGNDIFKEFELERYTFSFDKEYNDAKINNMFFDDRISADTSAKEDFVLLCMKYIPEKLLTDSFSDENGEKKYPGENIYKRIIEKNPEIPVGYEISEGKIIYSYKNVEEKQRYLNKNNISADAEAAEILTKKLEESGIFSEIVTSDEIKYFAQEKLLDFVSPQISVNNWEYVAMIRKREWIEKTLGRYEENISAGSVFGEMKNRISSDRGNISDYIARTAFSIREKYIQQGYLAYHPIDISYEVSEKTVALISENGDSLKGVEVFIEPVRNYPYEKSAAHILGSLGKISQKYEIDKYINENNYSRDDIIGKTGVEEKFEMMLNGKKGSQSIEVDVYGNRINTINTMEPVPGNNLTLTIDIELQKKAEMYLEKALKEIRTGGKYESKWGDFVYEDAYRNAYSASLVAVEVDTGKIIAMANYPSYDPNLFASGISLEDWKRLNVESKDLLAPKPLYNISMLTAIQPGSTFKMITALAGLEKGISPYERINCSGFLKLGNQQFGCWIWNLYKGRHGYENMYEALRDSCNYYFYSLALGENKVTGEKVSYKLYLSDIVNVAEKFGLGMPTGIEIDVPSEVKGQRPDPDAKLSNIRFFLGNYLKSNIHLYYREGIDISENKKSKDIEEILSWLNPEKSPGRSELIMKLSELGIEPEKSVNGKNPFVDTIKYDYFNQAIWNVADTLNISIGQGDNAYTPLQMARYISAIANDGYLNQLSIVEKIESSTDGSIIFEPEIKKDKISLKSDSYLSEIRKGMEMVAESSGVYGDFPIKVGAKTGTAEKDGINPETGEPYNDFAWYVAYAPAEKPKIAVVSVIFQGGSGRYPSPVVREIIGDYFNFEPEEEKYE